MANQRLERIGCGPRAFDSNTEPVRMADCQVGRSRTLFLKFIPLQASYQAGRSDGSEQKNNERNDQRAG
ncbi:MAG: hypothetical protein A2V78_12325 [Betaproteobacteria bacterium RBG_16_64_18]|nr:MAG: hypothetical protein A2V78_12325 [Betaproteobacteria bacterium RBG_16_64_18]